MARTGKGFSISDGVYAVTFMTLAEFAVVSSPIEAKVWHWPHTALGACWCLQRLGDKKLGTNLQFASSNQTDQENGLKSNYRHVGLCALERGPSQECFRLQHNA